MFSVYKNLHIIDIVELVITHAKFYLFMLLYTIFSCVFLDIVPYT